MAPRSKPYDRDTSTKWKHDLYPSTSGGSLAARLGDNTGRETSSGLSNRLGGRGRELLPDSGSPKRMHGFTTANAGVELLPASSSKAAARPAGRRTSGRGSAGEPGQRALVANSLKALSNRREPPRGESAMSIMGAARVPTFVRVEQLVQGTTAEDVQSSFSAYPITSARLVSNRSSRTATVEVEVADRQSAEALVKQYDGVLADGERLRLDIVERHNDGAGRRVISDRIGRDSRGTGRDTGFSNGRRREASPPPPPPPPSGKMYSDQITAAPVVTLSNGSAFTSGQSSLAARLGRR